MLFTVFASRFHCSGIQTFKERTSFFFFFLQLLNHLKLVALKKKNVKATTVN